MKRIICTLLSLPLLLSTALADIIDVPYPDLPPKPIPAPEPVDDGEVVVIKTLLCVAVVSLMIFMYLKKSKRVGE